MTRGIARITFVAALLAGTALAARAVDWPQSYHDGGHTGWNKDETVLSTANVSQLQQFWGQGVDCGDVAFALNGGTIYALGQGDCNGNWDLTSINAATGAKGWTVSTGNGGNFPVVATDNKRVFSVCGFRDSASNYGAVCAYRQSTGRLAWNWGNPCNCLPNSGNVLPPVYANGTVYFGYENGGGTCAGDTSYIVAADAATGSTLWTYVTGGCNSLEGYGSPPAAAGGHVYFGANHNLYAISQTDGSLVWSVSVASSGAWQVSVAATSYTVFAVVHDYTAGTTQAMSLDPATGAQSWSYSLPEGNTPPPAVIKGVVYVTANANLYALRAKDGALLWSTSDRGVAGSVSGANGVIYAGGGAHQYAVRAFNARNGILLWNSSGNGSTLNPPPIIANGILYNANDDSCGNICAWALPGDAARR